MAGLQDLSYAPMPTHDPNFDRTMSMYNALQMGFNDSLRNRVNDLKQKYNEEALSDFTQSNLLDRMKKQQDLDIHDYKTDPRYKDAQTRIQLGQANLQEASGKKAQETLDSNIAVENSENQYKQRRADLQNYLIQVDDLIASQHYSETGEPASPQALAQLQQYKQRLIQQLAYDEKEQQARWHDERQKELWGDRLTSAERVAASRVPSTKDPEAEFNKLAPAKVVPIIEYALSKQVDPITHEPLSEGSLKAWKIRLAKAKEQAAAYAPTTPKEGSIDLSAQSGGGIKTFKSPTNQTQTSTNQVTPAQQKFLDALKKAQGGN